MTTLGYKLSSEEHGPMELVDYAKQAEAVGFEFGLISDHYHPWTRSQGESPFVWGTLGGIATATDDFEVGTGVTCPTIRIHPAIVAQAAATAASMFDGRFFLGLGTGENLNEHVLGDRWPSHDVRLEMLVEAIDVMRHLWEGEMVEHDGKHYNVENAQLFTLPDEEPPIYVAAGGAKTAKVAGSVGDGFIGTAPVEEHIERYQESGGDGPQYAEVTVCWAEDEDEARQTALEVWPNGAMSGVGAYLPTPANFEDAADMVDEDDVADSIVCGPDADRHIEEIETYVDAGYDHVCVHQVGPDQEGFFEFYEEEVLPAFQG